MRTIFNIGLENNPYDHKGVLSVISQHCNVFHHSVVISSYLGNDEATSVIYVDRVFTDKEIENFCNIFTQECIALLDNGHKGRLIYNPNFVGEKYTFDLQYFVI